MITYCVATAIIQNGDKFFIAKRAETKKIEPALWEFVTGFVEDHESAEDTILRELTEEINADGRIERTLDTFEMIKGEIRWVVIPFLVSVADTNIKTTPDEHTAGRWVTWDELHDIHPTDFRYHLDLVERVFKPHLHSVNFAAH